ncbi:MAG: VOC family protein [Planctomycetota bacterium]
MIKLAIPVLHVASSAAAEEFYGGKLGFRKHFSYRADDSKTDPCYMGFRRDEAFLHLSSFPGDGVAGCAVYLVVEDVDAIYREIMAKGLTIAQEPVDQTWGNRELYVEDADGNSIRFVQEKMEG